MKTYHPDCSTLLIPSARILALVGCFLAQIVQAAGFSSIERLVVFGDQLVDTGRLGGVSESDNTLWVDDLADLLFLPRPTPYHPSTNPTGLNFAQIGATTLGDNPFDNGEEQLDLYLETVLGGGQIPVNSLVVLAFGINDLLQGRDAASVAAEIDRLLQRIISAGAENIIVPTVLPLGRTPDKNADVALWNAVAEDFNGLLALRLDQLKASFPSVDIMTLDIFELFEAMVADPTTYGLLDVTSASSFSAADPSVSLWWTLISPTSVAHSFVANRAYENLLRVLPADARSVSLQLALSAAGEATITARGPAMELLRIERSTDLENWFPVATYVDFDGEESATISTPTNAALYVRAR